MSNDITKALDLVPAPKIVKTTSQVPAIHIDKEDGIVEETKNNLQDLITIGKDAVGELQRIAETSQEPKAYDSLGKMLKLVADFQMKKYSVSTGKKTDKEGDIIDPQVSTINNTTQNLFVGTTAELQQMLEDGKDGK